MYLFQRYEELIANNHIKEELIVGGIGIIKRRLQDFGIECAEINYPQVLNKYLGRRIWKSTINEIANTPKVWPVFIKSVEGKRLSSKIINSIHDLVGCGCCDDNYEGYVAIPLILLQSGEYLSGMERYLMSGPIKVIGKFIMTRR